MREPTQTRRGRPNEASRSSAVGVTPEEPARKSRLRRARSHATSSASLTAPACEDLPTAPQRRPPPPSTEAQEVSSRAPATTLTHDQLRRRRPEANPEIPQPSPLPKPGRLGYTMEKPPNGTSGSKRLELPPPETHPTSADRCWPVSGRSLPEIGQIRHNFAEASPAPGSAKFRRFGENRTGSGPSLEKLDRPPQNLRRLRPRITEIGGEICDTGMARRAGSRCSTPPRPEISNP